MKQVVIATLCLSVFVLFGCDQQEQTANKSAQESAQARGYVETLGKINQESREDIANAVNKENEKLDEAKKIIEESELQEEKTSNKSQQQSNMNNIPEEINMTLAQTCKSATLKTNKGDVTVKFYPEKAPIAVANFCTLAEKGFYDQLIFHRVIKDFMIQGGDPTGTGGGGPEYKFSDELPKSGEYKIGSIAMANSGPNTNGSQFFIVTGDNGVSLPPLYTLFGEVAEGMDIVEKIQNVETSMSDMGEKSVPIEDVVIQSIVLETE